MMIWRALPIAAATMAALNLLAGVVLGVWPMGWLTAAIQGGVLVGSLYVIRSDRRGG